MNFIPKEHYMDDVPNSHIDGPNRIDHVDCSAGMDNKGRLYIWAKQDGSVSAYCHNCGLKGYTKTNVNYTRNIHKLRRKVKSTSMYLPKDLQLDPMTWPVEARAWVYSAGLTNEEIKKHGFGYSNTYSRVIIPCYASGGMLLGFQARALKGDKGPKYYTRTRVDKKLLFSSELNVSNDGSIIDLCVIVEDALSCIKVGRTHNSIALMGCSANDQIINHLTNRYKHVIIFLDNDNFDVKKKQEQLRRSLDLVMDTVSIIRHDKDPKFCNALELEELFNVY